MKRSALRSAKRLDALQIEAYAAACRPQLGAFSWLPTLKPFTSATIAAAALFFCLMRLSQLVAVGHK